MWKDVICNAFERMEYLYMLIDYCIVKNEPFIMSLVYGIVKMRSLFYVHCWEEWINEGNEEILILSYVFVW